MKMRWLSGLILWVLGGMQAQAQVPSREQLRAWAAELEECGFAVDLEHLQVEELRREECVADFDQQQDLLFRPGHFELMWHLYRALGHDLARDPAQFRQQVCTSLTSSFVAYYSIPRKTMVCIDSPLDDLMRNEHTWLHELVHAWRDQKTGYARLFDRGPRTFERTRVLQCLIEGEAEAIALDVEMRRGGQDLNSLDPGSMDDPLGRIVSGEAISLVYTAGRRFVVRAIQKEGLAALESLYEDAPLSSEQILHPEKRDHDAPSAIPVPEWPAQGLEVPSTYSDTLGELGLLSILLDVGAPRDEAWRAAIGWDGDRIQQWSTDSGGTTLLWRLLFDRAEDAEQFATVWSRLAQGKTRASDREVLWIVGDDEASTEALWSSALPPVEAAVETESARSTAAIEQALFAKEKPFLENGRWVVPELGLSIPAPEGWEIVEAQGSAVLMGPALQGFRDNLLPLLQANPGSCDADRLLAENRAEFAKLPRMRLHTSDVRTVGGKRCVYLTYGATLQGRNLEFRALVVPQGDRQIVVTGTLLADRAQTVAPIVDRALLGTVFLD